MSDGSINNSWGIPPVQNHDVRNPDGVRQTTGTSSSTGANVVYHPGGGNLQTEFFDDVRRTNSNADRFATHLDQPRERLTQGSGSDATSATSGSSQPKPRFISISHPDAEEKTHRRGFKKNPDIRKAVLRSSDPFIAQRAAPHRSGRTPAKAPASDLKSNIANNAPPTNNATPAKPPGYSSTHLTGREFSSINTDNTDEEIDDLLNMSVPASVREEAQGYVEKFSHDMFAFYPDDAREKLAEYDVPAPPFDFNRKAQNELTAHLLGFLMTNSDRTNDKDWVLEATKGFLREEATEISRNHVFFRIVKIAERIEKSPSDARRTVVRSAYEELKQSADVGSSGLRATVKALFLSLKSDE